MPTVSQLKKLIKELDPKARIHGPRKDELERIYECLKRGGDVKTVYKEVKNEVKTDSLLHELTVPQLRVAIKNIDFEASVWKLVRSELEDKLEDLRLWREYYKQLPREPELEYGEKWKARTINEEIEMIKNMQEDKRCRIEHRKWFMFNVMRPLEKRARIMLQDKTCLEIHKGKMTIVRSEFKVLVKRMGGKRQLMRECKLDKKEQNQHFINRQVAIKLRIYYHQKQLRRLSENLDSIYEEDSVREVSV